MKVHNDTAKILSQYGDIVMMRTHEHEHFLEFSKAFKYSYY